MNLTYIKHIITICIIMFVSLAAQAAYTLKGIITDGKGKSLAEVTVLDKATKAIVYSDINGSYSLNIDELPAKILFELQGYKKQIKTVTDVSANVDVVLVKEKFEYIAYEKQTKNNITSSVFSITGEELLLSRSNSLLIALQGRLPGLNILQNDGEPGKESFITQIRGVDSPNGSKVIFVIDGVERSITNIDVHEIERVTVLKDAAAVSMYGMRGSGGVLLITTKKGFNGKTKISVSLDHSLQTPTVKPSFVSAYDYVLMYNQRSENDNAYNGSAGVPYTDHEIERYRLADSKDFYPVRNMVDDFLKDYSKLTRVNLNFRGGSDQMKFFTSMGFSRQGSLFEHEPFKKYSYDSESRNTRFNFRTNLDVKVNPNLDVWINIGGSMGRANSPYAGGMNWNELIEKLYKTPNNAYIDFAPNNEVVINRDGRLTFKTQRSIYGELNRTGSKLVTDLRLGNTFGAKQSLESLLPGLSVSAQLSFDVHSINSQFRKRTYQGYEVNILQDVNDMDSLGFVAYSQTKNSVLSDSRTSYYYYMYDMFTSLNYNRIFNKKHQVSALFLAQRHMRQKEELLPTNYLGLAGNVSYSFNNKYLFYTGFSYQGSEQFAKGNRFGFFPSVGIGWVLSNEEFLEENTIVNYLKLRGSVGKVGNDAFAYGSEDQYLYLTSWNSNSTEKQLGNKDIQWETFKKYNLGVEAEFFNSFYLEADVFYNKNEDQIVKFKKNAKGLIEDANIPSGMMGLGSASLPPVNFGQSTNKGFEIVLGYKKQFENELFVNINGNLSYSINEQTQTFELPYDETYAYEYRRKGYSYNYNWGYKTRGLFKSQEEIANWYDQSGLGGVPIPGDIKYQDLTNDGVVNEKDIAPLGIGKVPQLFYGVHLSLNYKGFDVRALLNGFSKRNICMNGLSVSSNQDNFTTDMKYSWTEEKQKAGNKIMYPRLGRASSNYERSDFWMKDGSFIRLRNIELGYTLPEKITKAIKSSSIRVYVNGLNLFTWDKLSNNNFDVETGNATLNYYPILKAYNFGINVMF